MDYKKQRHLDSNGGTESLDNILATLETSFGSVVLGGVAHYSRDMAKQDILNLIYPLRETKKECPESPDGEHCWDFPGAGCCYCFKKEIKKPTID